MVQTLVVNISVVNKALEENQYFYSDIKKEGIELFNSRRYDFASFKRLSPTRRREIAEADFEEWYVGAVDSFKGFEFYADGKKFGWASFMLQQSIEMCYTAIEMVFSHYNPHEHNLFALRDRCVRFHNPNYSWVFVMKSQNTNRIGERRDFFLPKELSPNFEETKN
ncbi:MAG: hypothetical protein GQ574_29395 [Crocinitomix sp.]|nr:hypothetical protein [Crocinitomix sp.]